MTEAYGNWVKDQGNMAPNGVTLVSKSEIHVSWIIGKMANGMTAIEARQYMFDYVTGENRPAHINGVLATEPRQYPTLGDWHTRIKGVYTGSGVIAKNTWYIKV